MVRKIDRGDDPLYYRAMIPVSLKTRVVDPAMKMMFCKTMCAIQPGWPVYTLNLSCCSVDSWSKVSSIRKLFHPMAAMP